MSNTAPRVDLRPDHWETVRKVLSQHLPMRHVVAFGSRATWTAKEYSDLDLAILGEKPLPLDAVAALAEGFAESVLPFKVDVVVWANIDDHLRDTILRDAVDIQSPEAPPRSQKTSVSESRDGYTNSLEEMCELIVDCPHFTPEWTDHGYLVIRNQNIRNGRLDLSNRSYTHKHDYDRRIKRAKPQPGDIVFTREAPMGEVCLLPADLECCVGQRQVLLRPRHDVDGSYLFYALQSPFVRHQIFWNEGTGSTVSNVRIPALKALLIPRLGSGERFAAECLGALDAKIELNRRMNETLEATARAIFEDWFVDFGPTRAKVEGREAYLPDDLWELFPSALDDEGNPTGWEPQSISEFARVLYGAPFASKQFNTNNVGVPLIRIRDLATHEPGVSTEQVHRKGHLIEPGGILVGMDGEFRLHIWKGPKAWLNQRVCHFEPNRGVPRAFVAGALRSPLAFFERGKVGTTVIHLGKSDIDTIEVLQPGRAVLRAFADIAEPLLDQSVNNALQGRTLAQTRELLLPKLMTGEVRAQQAEQALGRVL